MNKWACENAWKTKYGNAPGRLWRFLEKNMLLSKKHLKKVRKGKFYPQPFVIDFKDWYKE